MEAHQVKELVQKAFDGDLVEILGEGCDFTVRVVSDQFVGLMPVKKQQKIYALLNEHIASGAIHAISMELYTQAQWQAKTGA
jgi:acid stress-induced BolA-like protein IbaG/YrbA